MKHTHGKSRESFPTGRFSIYRGVDGCDETYDIVCVATGEVIASFPFWDEDAETLLDARLFVKALHRFQRCGAYVFLPPLLRVIRLFGDKSYLIHGAESDRGNDGND